MGCISSKLLPAAELDAVTGASKLAAPASNVTGNGKIPNHVVLLTSSTYGVLNLNPVEEDKHPSATKEHPRSPPSIIVPKSKLTSSIEKEYPKSPPSFIVPKSNKQSIHDPTPEIINWTLGEGIDDARKVKQSPLKRPSKLPALLTPSPRTQGKMFGKENRSPLFRRIVVTEPNRVPKPLNSFEKKQSLTPQSNSTPKRSGSRRRLSPYFDPELVTSLERDLEQAEHIKQIVPQKRKKKKENYSSSILCSYADKCPPGGENALVLYTTSLRGIRKTYEECNAVRSAIECYDVCLIEKDISMDSGFREELRKLMGSKEARPPVLFVKGRLIGGAAEVLRLEEEGKFEMLMEGIPMAGKCCGDCGGMRFVMCTVCNGSCKTMNDEQRKMVKCGECNENGLIYCSTCSQIV